jgi:hypothetical protein
VARRKRRRPSRRRRGLDPRAGGAHDEKGPTPRAARRQQPPAGGDIWSLLENTSFGTFLGSVALIALGFGFAEWTDNDWFLLLGVPLVLQVTAYNVGTARRNNAALRSAWSRRRRR